jgi:hypothetical protein
MLKAILVTLFGASELLAHFTTKYSIITKLSPQKKVRKRTTIAPSYRSYLLPFQFLEIDFI